MVHPPSHPAMRGPGAIRAGSAPQIGSINDQNHIEYPFQSKTLATSRASEGRLVDLSYPAKGRQCEASDAGYDDSGGDHQWPSLSGHARAGRPKESLA